MTEELKIYLSDEVLEKLIKMQDEHANFTKEIHNELQNILVKFSDNKLEFETELIAYLRQKVNFPNYPSNFVIDHPSKQIIFRRK